MPGLWEVFRLDKLLPGSESLFCGESLGWIIFYLELSTLFCAEMLGWTIIYLDLKTLFCGENIG